MVARRRSVGEKIPDFIPPKDGAFPQNEEIEKVGGDTFFLYFATVIGNNLV